MTKESLHPEEFPLIDSVDQEILKHRDVHFGGLFSIMLDYYRKEGRGIQPEFNLSRIEELAEIEDKMKLNLAGLFLQGNDAIQVAEARHAYKALKDIYEIKQSKSIYPQLIADLILTEDEAAEAEIEAIVKEKAGIVPSLIELLKSEKFHDPLFPGYGLTPQLAVICLEKIGDKRAIISLFETLGEGDFFSDEQVIKALHAIGEHARDFLLRVLAARPLTQDNEKAAIALIAFKDDESVAEYCFDLLQQPDIQADPCLPTYLVLASVGLKDNTKREAFKAMASDPKQPRLLREDMKVLMKSWDIDE
jgi:hypothetical protein